MSSIPADAPVLVALIPIPPYRTIAFARSSTVNVKETP